MSDVLYFEGLPYQLGYFIVAGIYGMVVSSIRFDVVAVW